MVVAKIWFFSRKTTYMFWTQPAFAQSELDRRNCGICSKLTVKTLERSHLMSLRYLLAWIFRLRSSHRCIHRKTTVLESLLNKVAGFQVCNFIKKILQHRCFPVNIAKFLRAPIWKTFTNGCFCRLQNSLQSYKKPNWNKV